MFRDNKYLIPIMLIVGAIIWIFGGTLAYWNWQSSTAQKTEVTFTVGSDFSCGINGGGSITTRDRRLIPTDCTNSTYAIKKEVTTSITNTGSSSVKMNLNLKVDHIDTAFSESENLRYTLTTESNSCTAGIISTGTFSGKSDGDEIALLHNVTQTGTYYLYVWLDKAETNSATMDKNLDLSLTGDCTNNEEVSSCPISTVPANNSVPNAPVLDDGMIPVTIADNGTVTTVSSSDSSWYNYQNREWANAVLVKETGVKTRVENKVAGTVINPDDILAYYVWIPRYKYAFSEQTKCGCIDNVNETDYPSCYENSELISDNTYNNPRTIDIVFENGTPTKSTGTAIGTSYYTHPAFTFGTEELPGFWVGKFEMSHNTLSSSTTSNNLSCTTETCTNASGLRVLPNVSSIRYNDISNMWYATRSMEQSNNIFGLASSDSHMMKNSEWGAVAYLSHSNYGINDEIRINNYVQSTSAPYNTLTGCGASTANASYSTTCGITYGNATTYPQSTTGNISGIFDMSGGAWEFVMGNYNNTTGSSGFSSLPNAKYYNNYPSSVFTGDYSTNMTFCTLGTCGGQALNETANWYGDYAYFVYSWFPWFIRGGGYDNGSSAGAFASSYIDGTVYIHTSWHGVVVAK